MNETWKLMLEYATGKPDKKLVKQASRRIGRESYGLEALADAEKLTAAAQANEALEHYRNAWKGIKGYNNHLRSSLWKLNTGELAWIARLIENNALNQKNVPTEYKYQKISDSVENAVNLRDNVTVARKSEELLRAYVKG